MSSLTIIICILTSILFKTAICASLGNPEGASAKMEEKILNLGNGQVVVRSDAEKGHFPYVVQLQIFTNTTTTVCTGTIVSKLYVVSSALCFSLSTAGTILKVVVDAGNIKSYIEWNPLTSEQTVEAKSWWVHPGYNSTTHENDIAVITLSSAFVFTQYVSALALPSSGATFAEGTSCTIIGWGYDYNKIASTLQFGSANILSQANCSVNLYYSSYLRDSEICTISNTAAPRINDYGGPLVCTGTARDGSTGLVLAGIISDFYNYNENPIWFTSVHTRVSSFTDLINTKIGGTSSTTSPSFLLGAVAITCAIKLLSS